MYRMTIMGRKRVGGIEGDELVGEQVNGGIAEPCQSSLAVSRIDAF
jgi:hypothetical protein